MPKEFWILKDRMSNGDYVALDRHEDGYDVHVIEYSAFENLAGANKILREALEKIASCTPVIDGDCPSIARKALEQTNAPK